MKKIIKKLIYNCNFLHLGKKILLESSPDFSDNTKFVYDEMIREGINESYKIYWIVEDKSKFSDIKVKNVKFVNRNSFYFKYLELTSKVIIDCNRFICKWNKNQLRIYLTHGMPLKLAIEYFNDIGEYDYSIVTSDYFKEIFIRDFKLEPDKLVCTGYPRNDYINDETFEVFFPEIKRKKTVMWMPTYRNHKNANVSQTGINFEYGIPCISSKEELEKLNNKLIEKDILLLIKFHPAENISKLKKLDFSNIKIVDNELVSKNHKNIYDYLLGFDALITDYSSIFYDYMITGRKIGLAIPDILEYSSHVKLAFPKFEDYMKGFYIKKFSDVLDFFDYVSSDSDPIEKERLASISRFVKYNDGKSSKRVVDLMLKHLGGNK